MLRRNFIQQSISLPFALTLALAQAPNSRRKVHIDADTANEIDDLYAIVRALYAPELEILGLSSAQWNTRLSPPDTVLMSQRINEDLLRMSGRQDIPCPMGSEMIMGKPWGGTEPRDSPAAQLIIRNARAVPAGQKLTIICLGAVTNLASAIKIAPEIIPNISCFILSGKFFSDRKVWDKEEFNLRNDLNAANYLFGCENLDLTVMPINILYNFKFDQAATFGRLSGKGALWDYLVARWLTHSPSSNTWIMWDLALVEAVLRPELFAKGRFLTPPENKQREIGVYTEIDVNKVMTDFWTTIEAVQQRTR